jgi:hypothetical protein
MILNFVLIYLNLLVFGIVGIFLLNFVKFIRRLALHCPALLGNEILLFLLLALLLSLREKLGLRLCEKVDRNDYVKQPV